MEARTATDHAFNQRTAATGKRQQPEHSEARKKGKNADAAAGHTKPGGMLLCVLGGAQHSSPGKGAIKPLVRNKSTAAVRQAVIDGECDVLIVDPSKPAFAFTAAWAIRLGFTEEQVKHVTPPPILLPAKMTDTPAFYYLQADATIVKCQQFLGLYTQAGGGGICFINDIVGSDKEHFSKRASAAIDNFQGQLGNPKPANVSWSTWTPGGFTFIRRSHSTRPTSLGYIKVMQLAGKRFTTKFASTVVKLHREELYVVSRGPALESELARAHELEEGTVFG